MTHSFIHKKSLIIFNLINIKFNFKKFKKDIFISYSIKIINNIYKLINKLILFMFQDFLKFQIFDSKFFYSCKKF